MVVFHLHVLMDGDFLVNSLYSVSFGYFDYVTPLSWPPSSQMRSRRLLVAALLSVAFCCSHDFLFLFGCSSLIIMCLDVDLFGVIPLWIYWISYICRLMFFISCKKVSQLFLLFYYIMAISSSSFFFFLAKQYGLQDPTSPVRDWTQSLGSESPESWSQGIPCQVLLWICLPFLSLFSWDSY